MRLAAFVSALFLAATALADERCDLGRPSNDYPGYKSLGGWMLPDLEGREYGVEYLCQGTDALILLQQLVERTPDGLPLWKTLDKKKVKVAKGDGLLMGPCTRSGEDDPDLVAVGRHKEDGKAVVSQAFRADRQSGKFQAVAAKDTACEAIEEQY